MDVNFPHRDRTRLAPPAGQPIDFSVLVAGLVAAQAISRTARAEEILSRRRVNTDKIHSALVGVFAPQRSTRRTGVAALAGSFHLETARILASTNEQPK